MKILNISDICFPSILLGKNKNYVEKYFKKNNNELLNLTSLIEKENIDLVLIAGDVMGDVSADYYSGVFIWLLNYFEEKGIYCYFVAGNHDVDICYKEIVSSIANYKFIKEISGQLINHNNLKILGLSYFHTENISQLKSIISEKKTIDILLCHSQNKRIPFLFDFKTKYIVTGHYDLIFGNISNQIIIAINMGFLAIIDMTKKSHVIKYYRPSKIYSFFNGIKEQCVCKVTENKITFSNMYNENYVNDLRVLNQIKNENEMFGELSNDLKTIYHKKRGLPKISRTTQIQYLGKPLFDKINSIRDK